MSNYQVALFPFWIWPALALMDSQDPDVGGISWGKRPGSLWPGVAAGLTVGMWLMECLNPSGALLAPPPTQIPMPALASVHPPESPRIANNMAMPTEDSVVLGSGYGNQTVNLRNRAQNFGFFIIFHNSKLLMINFIFESLPCQNWAFWCRFQ